MSLEVHDLPGGGLVALETPVVGAGSATPSSLVRDQKYDRRIQIPHAAQKSSAQDGTPTGINVIAVDSAVSGYHLPSHQCQVGRCHSIPHHFLPGHWSARLHCPGQSPLRIFWTWRTWSSLQIISAPPVGQGSVGAAPLARRTPVLGVCLWVGRDLHFWRLTLWLAPRPAQAHPLTCLLGNWIYSHQPESVLTRSGTAI